MTSSTAAVDTLTEREALAARLATLKGPGIRAASEARGKAEAAASAAWEAVRAFEADHRGQDLSEDDQARLARLRQAAEATHHQQQEAAGRFKDISREIQALEDQLRTGAAPQVSLEDLQAHQQTLEAARGEVQRLEGLITTTQGQAPTVDETALQQAQERRREVLADIAEGRATQADLQKADQAVVEAENAAGKAKRSATQVREMAEALGPRLEAARERLEGLEKRTPGLLAAYYEGEGQKATSAYLKAARQVTAAYARLRALGKLVGRLDSNRRTLIMRHPERLRIPAPAGEGNQEGMIFDATSSQWSVIEAAIEAERGRLRDQGLDLV